MEVLDSPDIWTAIMYRQISPPEVRGAIGSLNQLTICLGILAALVVNVVFPPTAWRTMFWLATAPAFIMAFGASS